MKSETPDSHPVPRAVRLGAAAVLFVLVAAAFVVGLWSGLHETDHAQPDPHATGAASPSAGASRQATGARPSIALIVIDCLRADAVDAERGGVPLMPQLRARSDQGWRFSRAYSQNAWTKPSVASLMTSLYGEVHGVQYGLGVVVVDNQEADADAIPASMETAASFFKQAGYATLGVQSNINVDQRFGFAQGFDAYSMRLFPKFGADAVTDEALRLAGAAGPSPLFLYAHYMNAHAPYPSPDEVQALFGPAPAVTEGDRLWMDTFSESYHDLILNQLGILKERKRGDLSEAGRAWLRYRYDAALHFIDTQVGRLLEHIEKAAPNTIVVVTADHGEEFWEHGSVGHGKTLYEEVVHVPLMIWGPGITPGSSDVPVELIDVLPTLAARAGLSPRDAWQGRNLGGGDGVLAVQPKPVFSMTHSSLRAAGLQLECVIDGGYKLLDNHKAAPMVFDLGGDPGELRGGSADGGEVGPRLKALLEIHRAANAKHPAYATQAPPATIDAQTAEQLNAIGYGAR